MTSRHGVHAARQTAFRLPEGLLAWLKEQAGREGDKVTMTAIAERALERERERCEGITTSAAPAAAVSPPPKRPRRPRADTSPAATFKQPEPPAKTAAQPEGASDIAAFFRRRNGDQ
jgi:hypothetical protein